MWRTLFFPLVMIAVLAQASYALAQSAPRLWSTVQANRSACASFSRAHGPETFSRTVQGFKWPHTSGGGIEFIDHTIAHLNAAALGRANDGALKARLLTAARGRAFTTLDFEGPGGSSPAFVSAIMVKTVAYATDYLRQRGALTRQDLGEIAGWIKTLSRNAKQRAGSADHKMAIVVSNLMWAAASGDTRAFKTAARRYLGAISRFDRDGSFSGDIRNNNAVLHQAIGGAAVLHLNGINALGVKSRNMTFAQAVGLHAARVANVGTAKLKTSGDKTDVARSIMRAQGWGTHLAWIPVYLSIAPAGESRNAVINLDRALRRIDRKPYYGLQMGVHTGCLFGR